MPEDLLKVGELAVRTGVTVRTLHHYEEIGLLAPSRRTASGHRLYGREDVERLHRIRSLRQLGFSLEEIRGCLERPEYSLRRVVRMHVERLDRELELQRRLRERLEMVARVLDSAGTVPVEDLLRAMDMMEKIERHYTPEQLEKLRERREALGEDRIVRGQEEWGELIALVREQMDRGADPGSPEVQALAARWRGLVEEFTGGDPGITRSLASVYRNEPQVHTQLGNVPDREMMEYMARAGAMNVRKEGGS